MKMRIRALALVAGAMMAAPALAQEAAFNDYPTIARADYVFGCMAANGQTREALERCSCSIDIIATILPFKRYEQAETVLSLRQLRGERTSAFRSAASMREMVADLRRAQAEAEMRCF